jgi:DNA-binding MarR family transcriptional regulator
VLSRLDIAAEAALLGDVLHVAHRQPDVPRTDARGEGLVGGPATDSGKDEGAAQHTRVAGPEFVVHQPPEITNPHSIQSLTDPDSRMVAMSNPAEAPGTTAPFEDTLDTALTNVEHQISLFWRRARSISQQLSREVHPDMEPAAYGLLSVIRKSGPIRLTELASSIGVGKPSVSRQIAFLESIGLVLKEADPLDGRAQTIRLTAEGEEKMHQVQDARRQVFRERLGEWPVEDLDALATYMAKLNATYERDGFPRDDA